MAAVGDQTLHGSAAGEQCVGHVDPHVDHSSERPDISFTQLDATGTQQVAGWVVQDEETQKIVQQISPRLDYDRAGANPGAVMVWFENDGSHHFRVAQKVGVKQAAARSRSLRGPCP